MKRPGRPGSHVCVGCSAERFPGGFITALGETRKRMELSNGGFFFVDGGGRDMRHFPDPHDTVSGICRWLILSNKKTHRERKQWVMKKMGWK